MLASFLKSIGCIIPLMDAMYASYYTREVMVVLVREFQTPDEEMKKIVLKARQGFQSLAHLTVLLISQNLGRGSRLFVCWRGPVSVCLYPGIC